MIIRKKIAILLFAIGFLLWSCDYGKLGGADETDTYYPGDEVFEERMTFLSGIWYSHYAGIGLLDSYRIRKWSELTNADKTKTSALFSAPFNISSPKTYITKDNPKNSDFVLLYDDTVYGQDNVGSGNNENWGFCYMGIVRAINIFNYDKNRGAIIIEYFEGADPAWLSEQGLSPGGMPFFGIYYRVLQPDIIQMANPVDLTALFAGELYYTERETLQGAIEFFNVENEAEFIIWGGVDPQNRQK
ncbi:MAG: hypothetical protein LBI28_04025 [Treponema sp.]|jgi:hypothetical protein|nr:hypothetical protein [Treponema sp.]